MDLNKSLIRYIGYAFILVGMFLLVIGLFAFNSSEHNYDIAKDPLFSEETKRAAYTEAQNQRQIAIIFILLGVFFAFPGMILIIEGYLIEKRQPPIRKYYNFCPNCGRLIAEFCPHCGSKIKRMEERK